jgi:hypothetical protein
MSHDELAATKAELAKLQAKYDHLLMHATAKSAISNALPAFQQHLFYSLHHEVVKELVAFKESKGDYPAGGVIPGFHESLIGKLSVEAQAAHEITHMTPKYIHMPSEADKVAAGVQHPDYKIKFEKHFKKKCGVCGEPVEYDEQYASITKCYLTHTHIGCVPVGFICTAKHQLAS